MRVSTVEDTMPPIIGTAMRCISSEPVPWLHRIGSSPAIIGNGLGYTRQPSCIDRARPAWLHRPFSKPYLADGRVPRKLSKDNGSAAVL